MEYYFLGWTFWAIALAMHALWWAWVAPNINTKLRTDSDAVWKYFHWVPYITTLSLLFWPFLALDKIQNWSPSDSKSVLATIYIFSLEALVIFACFTKMIACKDCPNLFGDIAARVAMGHRHKIQKSFAPHGGTFFFANLIGMIALYSFVISPNQAKANAQSFSDEKLESSFVENGNDGYQSVMLGHERDGINTALANASNNIVINNSSAPANNIGLAANDNNNRIIGPDGKIIEGEIIAKLETAPNIESTGSLLENLANSNSQTNEINSNSEANPMDNSSISLTPAYMPTWQLVESSKRFADDEINNKPIEQSVEFLGQSSAEETLINSFE